MRWIVPGGNIRRILLKLGLAMLLVFALHNLVPSSSDRHFYKQEQAKQSSGVVIAAKPQTVAPQPIEERPREQVAVPPPVEQPKPVVTPAPAPAPKGDKYDLMRAAGIAESDFKATDYIVTHESGWRHTAVNASSGATGLCQALPASKMASAGGDYLTNPVTQLKWCHQYASHRYGGWLSAFAFWQINRWW